VSKQITLKFDKKNLELKEEKFEEFVDSPLFRQRIKLDQIPQIEETKEEINYEL